MDASSYALYHGIRRTRTTLRAWQESPLPVLGAWVAGSALAAAGLLAAVLVIATVFAGYVQPIELRPPFAVGNPGDVATVLSRNLLVLALHAMACVAGFIAGSSLPLQAESKSGVSRWVHEHGGRIAIAFVVCATTFSLSAQAYLLGHTLAGVAHFVKVPPALLLLGLLPHALPELIALFLPLAAWIIASAGGVGAAARRHRRDGRDRPTRAGGRGVRRGVRLAAPVHRAHRPALADRGELGRVHGARSH